MVHLRDAFTDALAIQAETLAYKLAAGDLTLQQWTEQQRALIRTAYVDQYVMGRGGRQQMTQADWGTVGQKVRAQYQYLDGFAKDLAAGKMTPQGAAARAKLYTASATAAFETGKAGSYGLRLPAYPADGSTPCKVSCRCHWRIEDGDSVWNCFWVLGARDERNCNVCPDRAARWAPYVATKQRHERLRAVVR